MQINTFHRVLPQKHRGIVRNLELIHEELDERQLPDKSKQEEEEERRKERKKKEKGDKMSKLNHKNGNHGDGKLEEQGLIDPNENKIGEEEYLFCKERKDLKDLKICLSSPSSSTLRKAKWKLSKCSACEEGQGVCAHLLVVVSVLLIFLTMPFSLCLVVKVVQVIHYLFSSSSLYLSSSYF